MVGQAFRHGRCVGHNENAFAHPMSSFAKEMQTCSRPEAVPMWLPHLDK